MAVCCLVYVLNGVALWHCIVVKVLFCVCSMCGHVRVVVCVAVNGVGQLGRAVKAIDSKSIGVTRVSSNLTAVDLF
jgi:hypothetical protein